MNADKALELARKAYPNNEELRVAYMLGLNEGYELHKDEMMKEAVKGEVLKDGTFGYIEFSNEQQFHSLLEQFQNRDKVRIIIEKEDK